MSYIVKLTVVVKDEQIANEIASDISTAWNTMSLPGFLDPRIISWTVSTEEAKQTGADRPPAGESEAQ